MNPSNEIPRPIEPFGESAVVLDAKLTDYILSLSHRVGANKARVFKSALGIGKEDADVLRKALLDAAKSQRPNFVRRDNYGTHYAIVFELSYGSKSAFVRPLWVIKTGETIANLVSAFVITEKRARGEANDDD